MKQVILTGDRPTGKLHVGHYVGSLKAVSYTHLVFILMIVVLSFIMGKTKFGKRVHLVGTNEKASNFAGINNVSVLIRAYMLSGIVSAVAGLLSLSRINSAKADFGSSYTMQTILISVLGGINPDGGFGSIPGVAIAVLILQMLSSYLNMFPSISNYYRDLIWGVALIAVLIMNLSLIHIFSAKSLSGSGMIQLLP